ncbi:MAG: acyltransferase [Lachnospiraceae bacterium]|nr:acyltransferase [Lachnospiraceae bacterium]
MDNTNNKTLMNKRETDWFRGIAAVMVVLSHYAEWIYILTTLEGNAETFRIALTKLGVYGVDIFFLFSGYAMVKSLGKSHWDGKMSWQFIWKRIKNVFIPYLIVIGIIELLSEGLTSMQDFWRFIIGYNYWYMCVLFIFYIGFIVIYAVIRVKGIRVIAFSVFTYALSYKLYQLDMFPFWYVSNIAFAIGIIVGEYEETAKKIIDKVWIPMTVLLTIGMLFVTRWGLTGGVNFGGNPEDYQLWFKIGATVVWTLLILILASKCRIKEKIFVFLGRNSLYIYLTHVYVFMRCINNLTCDMYVRFIISPICIIAVSFLCSLTISTMWKLIAVLSQKMRNNTHANSHE